MKVDWNKRYTTVAGYACAVACLILLFFCVVLRFSVVTEAYKWLTGVLSPIIIGMVLSYLFNPMMKFYEAKLFAFVDRKKPNPKLKRGLSVALTVLTMLIIITAFLLGIVPQVISGYNDLVSKAGDYIASANTWIKNLIAGSDFLTEQYNNLIAQIDAEKLETFLNNLMNNSFDVILSGASSVFGFFRRFFTQAVNILLGIIFMIYMLSSKEKLLRGIRKVACALFPDNVLNRIYGVLHKTDTMFGGFIIGKLIDSGMVGLMTLFMTWLFKIPYYPLVSVIVAVTDVIPCFGPFLGAIPCIFIIFVAEPIKAVWFALIILVIQQIDGNYVAPKILGSATGLSSLGVMLAITLMSGFLGITGLFIGVPTFAVIYALIREAIDKRLVKKNLPTELSAYGAPVTDDKDPPDENGSAAGSAGAASGNIGDIPESKDQFTPDSTGPAPGDDAKSPFGNTAVSSHSAEGTPAEPAPTEAANIVPSAPITVSLHEKIHKKCQRSKKSSSPDLTAASGQARDAGEDDK